MSCIESCYTYKSIYNKTLGFPKISKHLSRCKHIYFYFDHKDYGFMSIRLQTWSPFNIQIALNGRELLRHTFEKSNCTFLKERNKFLHISDFPLAQKILTSQLHTDWNSLLNSFLPLIFPSMKDILGDMYYSSTLDQSEWARDFIFDSSDSLKPIMHDLLYHSFVSDNSHNVFKYMNITSPKSDYSSRVNKYEDGFCCKVKSNKNYLKFYSFLNNLRFEMTMNNPSAYKVTRFSSNTSHENSKKIRPLI